MSKQLSVGFARKESTITDSLPLMGYGNTMKRMSEGVRDGLFSTCIAVTDDDNNTVLLITRDLSNNQGDFSHTIREAIEKETGISKDNIVITCTHTHSAPDINREIDSCRKYRESLLKAEVSAAKEALADRAPAEVYVGRTKTENLNFIRHYVLDDGRCIGDNHGLKQGHEIVGHASVIDPTMHIIRFAREEKPDVLYVNWRAHATKTGKEDKVISKLVSADFPLYFRNYVEKKTGCLCGYYQGAAGNVNSKSRIPEEDAPVDVAEFSAKLGDYCINALPTLKPVNAEKIVNKAIPFTYDINHALEDKIENARECQRIWQETNDSKEVRKYSLQYGIFSPFHANAIVGRSKLGKTDETELHAIKLGDIGLVYAPGELFDSLSTYIKENSPLEETIVMGYTNEAKGYIPSKEAFDYGCYEADCTKFSKGTGEKIAETLIEALKTM